MDTTTDIRLYYFDGGVNKKVASKYHKHTSVDSCVDTIEHNKKFKWFGEFWMKQQFVIVQFYGVFQSRIIGVYQNGNLKLIL